MSAVHTREASGPAVRWLLGSTRDILAPLALASVLACLTRLASLAIYYVAALGLVRAAGYQLSLPGAGLGFPALAGWLAALALAKGALRYAEQYVGHKVAFLALARLRTQIYSDYERQAPFDAGRHSGAMLQAAVRDIDRVEVFFAHTLPPAVAALVTSLVVSFAAGLAAGARAGLILLAGYLLLGVLVPALGLGRLRRAAIAEAAARSAASRSIADTLSGAEVVFSLDAQQAMVQRLHRDSEPDRTARSAPWVLGARATAVSLIPWISALVLLVTGAGTLPPGLLVLVLVLAVPSFEAVRAVDGFVGSLQESLASIRRLHANHLARHPVPEPDTPRPLAPVRGGLRVADLGIIRGGRQVVDGVCFELEPGARLGLVGESGSGKSSIAAALLRAVPASGTMLLDGVELGQLDTQQLRAHVALVAQDDSLVRGTLRENLLLGSMGINDQQLQALLEEVGLGPWLATQRSGLDTRLGERGSRISGGQRQRLTLVRALLRNPRILILDEATSALDAATEQLVMAAVQRRVETGTGLLMISHRLGVLEDFEQVLVLDQGRQAERGGAAHLLANPASLFARMRLRELESIEAGK